MALGLTAAGWGAVAGGTSAVAGIGSAVYQAKHKPSRPNLSNAPSAQANPENELKAARDRRRNAMGGGLASTILAGNTGGSTGGATKTLLGQ